jgi:hypothetical protein
VWAAEDGSRTRNPHCWRLLASNEYVKTCQTGKT